MTGYQYPTKIWIKKRMLSTNTIDLFYFISTVCVLKNILSYILQCKWHYNGVLTSTHSAECWSSKMVVNDFQTSYFSWRSNHPTRSSIQFASHKPIAIFTLPWDTREFRKEVVIRFAIGVRPTQPKVKNKIDLFGSMNTIIACFVGRYTQESYYS